MSWFALALAIYMNGRWVVSYSDGANAVFTTGDWAISVAIVWVIYMIIVLHSAFKHRDVCEESDREILKAMKPCHD